MAKIEELNFGDLTKEEVEARVQQCGVSKNGTKWARLLLFKDARVDMNRLDKTVGVANWQRRHYECKGVLFCEIGIKINNEWVWKSDAGKPSNTEKEKGEASDCFKRAGFNWGIGRELYTAPNIFVSGDFLDLERKGQGYTCKSNFEVTHFKVESKDITELEISTNDTVVFTYKKGAKKTTTKATKTPKTTTKATTMDKKTFDSLIKLSEIMKAKGIKEEVLKEQYNIKGSLKKLEYKKVLNILNDLQ
jgi:hypothetical protein